MLRYIVPIVLFLALLVMFWVGLDPERNVNELPSPFLGKPAPEFELPTLKDPSETIGSATYAGETVLINVWATWCVGCRQEHDFLLALAESGAIQRIAREMNYRVDRNAARSRSTASTGVTIGPTRSTGSHSLATPTSRARTIATAASVSTGASTAHPRLS